MKIELRPINEENFRPVVGLDVGPGQNTFVATNVFSIAESKVSPYLEPRAVYADDELVGFTLYGRDPETGKYWIVRLMVDAAHQGKGYGRAAVLALIEELRAKQECGEIFLSLVPGNAAAEGVYQSIGFARTGEIEHGEIVMRYVF